MSTIKIKKADLIILIIFLALAGIVFIVNANRSNSAGQLMAEVRIDGEIVDEFFLEENITKEYNTEYGYNKLVIQDSVVTVIDADCSDFICVNTKDGSGMGDSIVCVPNRFTVEIVGGEGGDVDAIAQ